MPLRARGWENRFKTILCNMKSRMGKELLKPKKKRRFLLPGEKKRERSFFFYRRGGSAQGAGKAGTPRMRMRYARG